MNQGSKKWLPHVFRTPDASQPESKKVDPKIIVAPQDAAKAAAEALVDLAKGVSAEAARDHLRHDGQEFAKDVLTTVLPEVMKAGTGMVGKLVIAAISRQFDLTARRLKKLEARLDANDAHILDAAQRKFVLAMDYPQDTQDEARFRQQLIHEARQALEAAAPIAEAKKLGVSHIQFGMLLCALYSPGGNSLALQSYRALAEAVPTRAKQLRDEAAVQRFRAKNERHAVVRIKVGERDTGVPRFWRGEETGLTLKEPVYRDELRLRSASHQRKANDLEAEAARLEAEAEAIEALDQVARALILEAGIEIERCLP